MPDRQYIEYLSDFVRMIVYFRTHKSDVENFVIKLEYLMNGVWLEVERFDCFHGYVHKDILDRSGNKKRVIRYETLALKAGAEFAKNDFKENFELYVGRFLHDRD